MSVPAKEPAVQPLSPELVEMLTGLVPRRLLGPTGLGAPTLLTPPERPPAPEPEPRPPPKRIPLGPTALHRSRG
ncbi:hypothetical protein DFR76_106542 [Nocardia pseudobrasiliensis]|uniref:Uncharacterized protein n=1 Tax=Nocardia pseudobrasiliensis TaxID=45979 RepID=A0A370I4Y8_9NOCA|nr:hypothetical protein DFR76_106542 [Nocardia pseudobrasiliensis]